jgi:hypothetical protein
MLQLKIKVRDLQKLGYSIDEPPTEARRSPNGLTVCPLFTMETWYNFPTLEAASIVVTGLAGLRFLAT